MRKIVMRADDLGYSEAVNYGILKSIVDGLIGSVGLMTNMEAAEHGVGLIKELDIALGQHINISAGNPICDPRLVSSLTRADGAFKSSKEYHAAQTDFVVLDEVVLEIEAQLQRFIELTGQKPAYLDGHAVASDIFFCGLEIVAERHSLKYSPLPEAIDKPVIINDKKVLLHSGSYPDKSAIECLQEVLAQTHQEELIDMIVYHPGYLDAYILTHSSLTKRRTYETAMLCEPSTKQLLAEHDVELITYRDL